MRLAASVLVSALIRQVAIDGGSAMVLAKGDPTAGALLLILAERGVVVDCRERGGDRGWIRTGPANPAEAETLAAYLEKRRRFDPDLWVVELDGISSDRLDALLKDLG